MEIVGLRNLPFVFNNIVGCTFIFDFFAGPLPRPLRCPELYCRSSIAAPKTLAQLAVDWKTDK